MDFYLTFGIILVISAIYVGFKDLRLGLLILIALLPLNHKETLSFIHWNLTPPRVFLAGLVMGAISRVILERSPRGLGGRAIESHTPLRQSCGGLQSNGKDTFIIFLLLLWIIRAVSLIQSLNLVASFKLFAFFSAVVFFYLLFRVVYKKYGRVFLERVISLYLKVGLVVAVLGLVQLAFYYLTGKTVLGIWPVEGGIARPGSTFWDINHFAAYAASLALMFFGRYAQSSNSTELGFRLRQKPSSFPSDSFWNFSAFLLMSLMVGLTASESGMMVLGVGFTTISFFLLLRRSEGGLEPVAQIFNSQFSIHNQFSNFQFSNVCKLVHCKFIENWLLKIGNWFQILNQVQDDKGDSAQGKAGSGRYSYHKKVLPVAIFALVGSLAVAGYFFKLGLGGRTNFREFYKINFTLENDSMASHLHLAEGALEIFNKHPLIGGGYGSFNEQFRSTSLIGAYLKRDPIGENRIPAHSIWLEALAETGLLGFLLLVGVLLLPLVIIFANIFRLDFATSHPEFVNCHPERSEGSLYVAGDSSPPPTAGQNDEELKVRFIESVTFLGVLLGLAVAGAVYSYNLLFFWFLIFLGLLSARDTLSKVAAIKFWPAFKNWVWRNREVLAVGFLVAFSSVFTFWQLDRNALIPWDEGIYAGVSREMVERKDPFTLYWNQEPWFEKPPLFFWMQSFSFVYLDFKAFGARLPVALFSLAGVFLTYLFGKKLFSRRVGFFSAIILTTTVHWVAWSRMAMLDVPVVTLILASLYFFWRAWNFCHSEPRVLGAKNPISKGFRFLEILRSLTLPQNDGKYWLLFGVFLGLTFMTKGPVVVVPLAVAGSFVILMGLMGQIGPRGQHLLRSLILTTIPFLLITVPWHYLMVQKYGGSFADEYFLYHMLKRASHGIEQHGEPFWWYNTVIRHWARHWYVLALAGLAVLVGRVVRGLRRLRGLGKSGELKKIRAEVFVLIWVLVTFFVFSFSKSKIQWYIMPIYPAIAVLCGWFVGKLQDWFSRATSVRWADRENPKSEIRSSKQILNSKLKILNVLNLGFSYSDLFGISSFALRISGGRAALTILVSFFLLVVGTGGLLLNRRMWSPENLSQQVATLSDAVWRLPGLEKKFYVADAPPPLPIFYSGRKVDTTDGNGIVAALYNPHVAILSKQGTYRKVLRQLEPGQLPPAIFAETEDYILYGR